MLQTIQIALNTADMPGSLRLYSEAFGFVNAGAQGIWGEICRVQGLTPEDRALMWWMIGRQKFFQLEFFHHTRPAQRPLAKDWRPSDHGWVRFGIAVDDFDACVSALARHDVPLISPAATTNGLRRAAIRDPFAGIVVEVIERAAVPSGQGPDVVYVTSSVSDLEAARVFYAKTLGFDIQPLDRLHTPADEALWGLAGAKSDGFLVRTGDILLEIVSYRDPVGRPKPADYCIADQGMMNIALGARHTEPVAAALKRLNAAGLVPPYIFEGGGILCAYIIDRERELELAALPEELDALVGFTPAADFIGALPGTPAS